MAACNSTSACSEFQLCVYNQCTCPHSFAGDLLDDAGETCHIAGSFVVFMWAVILVMATVLSIDGARRLHAYLAVRKAGRQAAPTRSLARVSRVNDPVFRILVLIIGVGVVFGGMALTKVLSADNAVGTTPSTTILYSLSWTVFPTFAFQLIWSWVKLVCDSALGEQDKMAVILSKLRTGFLVSWVGVLVSAWIPSGLLLVESDDESTRNALFAIHFIGLALGNIFLTGYCINVFGAKIVALLTPADATFRNLSVTELKKLKTAFKFTLVRRASFMTGLGNACFFVAIIMWPWLRHRSSYTVPMIANSALSMVFLAARMFSFLNKGKPSKQP